MTNGDNECDIMYAIFGETYGNAGTVRQCRRWNHWVISQAPQFGSFIRIS